MSCGIIGPVAVAFTLVGCSGVDPRVEDFFAVPGPRADAQGGIGIDRPREGGTDALRMEASPNGQRDGTIDSADAALSPDHPPLVEPDVASHEGGDNADRPVADGGPVDAPERDGCLTACGDKRVFVTSEALANGGFAMGSVAEADHFCQAAAEQRHFGGTWRAWISDSVSSPDLRFTHSETAYRLLDGTLVASSWAELIDGRLAHAIDLMDSGMWVPMEAYLEVWTGTEPSGASSGYTCSDWTNTSDALPYADVGTVGRNDSAWTQAYRQFCDRSNIHLYCFEQ
jgi:hypothetical protein